MILFAKEFKASKENKKRYTLQNKVVELLLYKFLSIMAKKLVYFLEKKNSLYI